MFSTDASGEGFHPVLVGRGGDHGEGYGMQSMQWGWWIFALVIIFFALLLIWGRRDHKEGGLDQLLGLAAVGNMRKNEGPAEAAAYVELNNRFNDMSRQIGHSDDLSAWRKIDGDICHVNHNVDQRAFDLSGQVQQTRFDQLLGVKDIESKQAMGFANVQYVGSENTQKLLTAIGGLEKRMDQNVIDGLRDALHKEQMAASQYRQDLLFERANDRVISSLTRRHGLPVCPPPYAPPPYTCDPYTAPAC
jgi:hypothetical protein